MAKRYSDAERNEALAQHFARIAAGRSIGKLRADMAEAGHSIGTGTLQRLQAGDYGARLGTLRKFAAYAGMEPESLLVGPGADKPSTQPKGSHLFEVTQDERNLLHDFHTMMEDDQAEIAAEIAKRAAKMRAHLEKIGASKNLPLTAKAPIAPPSLGKSTTSKPPRVQAKNTA